MSSTFLMVLQAVLSVFLIILVLLQFGKGAETGLFSAGGGDSVMTGPQKGNILAKATIVIAFLFFANSTFLARIESKKSATSIMNNIAPIARPLNSDALNAAAAGSGSASGSGSATATATSGSGTAK